MVDNRGWQQQFEEELDKSIVGMTPGQIVYEAYAHAIFGFTGAALLQWPDVKPEIKTAWEAAAAAVIAQAQAQGRTQGDKTETIGDIARREGKSVVQVARELRGSPE